MVYRILTNGEAFKIQINQRGWFKKGWKDIKELWYHWVYLMSGVYVCSYHTNKSKTKQECIDYMKKTYGESAKLEKEWIVSPGGK